MSCEYHRLFGISMCESVGIICNFEKDDILKDKCIHCNEAALSHRMFDL
jgi:hypothetical protein